MCYTLYLGLDKEYELLQSEEFVDRVQEMTDEDVAESEVDVDTSRSEVVTDIQRSSSDGND